MGGRDFCVKRMHFVKRLLVVPIVLPLCVDMSFKRKFLTALNPKTTKPRRPCRKRPFFEAVRWEGKISESSGCTLSKGS
jgi:hypothetical protein